MADFFIEIFVWTEGLGFSTFMRESSSLLAYPFFLFLHTLGMSIVAGGAAIICFPLLGVWPRHAPLKPLERVFPLVYVGFWVEVVTGVSMFMKDASSYGRNPDLYWKLGFIAAGVALMALVRRRVFHHPSLDVGPLPDGARFMAVGVLACWLAAIVTGRLLAYLNPSLFF
jgi:hypothetical protein